MPLGEGTTYGSLAYVALYIWNKTGNLHGCAFSREERKEWERRGAFIRLHKSTFFLFTWTSFIPLISGGPSLEWRKLEIRAGRDHPRILFACLWIATGFEWWQINEIVQDNVTVVTYYFFIWEKKMRYTRIRDCKSKGGIVMRSRIIFRILEEKNFIFCIRIMYFEKEEWIFPYNLQAFYWPIMYFEII